MPTVLIFAYYFPPLGMGGVQRTLKFVKHLSRFGWRSIVITVDEVYYYAHDPELLDEIPPDAVIHRVQAPEPLTILRWLRPAHQKSYSIEKPKRKFPLSHFLRPLLNFLFIPDTKVIWSMWAGWVGRRILKKGGVDLIFSTAPPFSQHLTAIKLGRTFNIPVAVDFRDDWTGGEFDLSPTPFHGWLASRMERRILSQADAIISVADPITERLRQKSNLPREKFYTITNGYDAEDFAISSSSTPDIFTITYCGTISSDRSPVSFLRALAEIFHEREDLRGRVRLVCVGAQVGIDLMSIAQELRIDEAVQMMGYHPHSQSIRYLLQSHLLLLLISSESRRAEDVPTGKIYEYLAARKPILAIAPRHGIAARLIQEYGTGIICAYDQMTELKQAILHFYQLYTQNQHTLPANTNLTKFERKQLTQQLITIFSSLIEDE